MGSRICSVEGCGLDFYGRGFCRKHWQRWRYKSRLAVGLVPNEPQRPRGPCAVGGCERQGYAGDGLCTMHYQRRRLGIPLAGPPMKRPKGTGGFVRGYKALPVVSGSPRILEHRALMEELVGRPLHREETVHHVNGDKADNTTDGPLVNFRSGNLELWSTDHPAGQRVADKVAFAERLLRRYAPHLLRESSG